MLKYLFVKLKRKRFNFADYCHLPFVYRQKYAEKLYTVIFYGAVEFYQPVGKRALQATYRWSI